MVTNGLATNSGTISLAGGTFDNNGHALDNNGQITGNGTVKTGGITNTGTMTFWGSGPTTVNGNVTNNNFIGVTGQPATFANDVTNNGLFQVTDTTAVFTGTFTNNGILVTDPATVTFMTDFTAGTTGYIKASSGDTYQMAAGFLNNSTVPASWRVGGATLEFLSGTHAFLPGNNKNFAWGTLEMDTGAKVTLEGSGYVLSFLFGSGEGISDILSAGNYTLYYNPLLNPGLGDKTYQLSGGGSLTPSSVPVPGAMWLLASGLAGLISLRRRTGRT
jgi:hypothetical protein